MNLVRSTATCLLLAAVACGGAGETATTGTEWSGTVTAEGDVTTVVNQSGSLWGGHVALIEEASIGVEAGEDAYMLGQVSGVAATDEDIYVLDQQVPVLRVYDWSGRHVRDIGAEGSGPGEFRRPDNLVVGPDGLIYVRDYGNNRIMILSPEGAEVGTLPLEGGFATSTGMVMTLDGTLYNYQRIPSDDPQERLRGLMPRSLAADDSGAPILPPDFGFESWSLTARTENMSMSTSVPFAPAAVWTVAPSGAVIAGVSEEYRFEIRYPDGRVSRVVKAGDRVAVDPGEADWFRKSTTARIRANVPDWKWNGMEIPAVKPAYQRFYPDYSGRIWVSRPGLGSHVEGECSEDPQPDERTPTPCWGSQATWDVFDEEGRFLGGADIPEIVGSYPTMYIRGDTFLAAAADDLGTVLVKRYRLAYPQDE